MKPGTVTIHVIPRDREAGQVSDWRLLSPDERVRAASFLFPRHAEHWISCRAALRRIVGDVLHVPPDEVPLLITPLGKPVLAEPFEFLHFSLSHCKDLALLALCVDGPVGVDVEPLARSVDLADCENTFCHPEEISALPTDPTARMLRLLELWTAKEALLKCLGTGFSHPPETILILPGSATSDTPLPGIENQILHRLKHPSLADHCAALAAPASASHIEFNVSPASTSPQSPAITEPRSAHSDG